MSLTKSYDKRPESVEAVQLTAENIDEVAKWCGGKKFGHINNRAFPTDVTYSLYLHGSSGPIAVSIGDYILRQVGKHKFEHKNASSFEHQYILKEEDGRHETLSEEA